MHKWLCSLFAFSCLLTVDSQACTGIKLTTEDGDTVHGRTLEFGVVIDSSVAFVPRNYSFTATTPLGNGMSYEAKYACLGTICFNQPAILDGMNEKGLSIGSFYFPGFANYTPTTKENQSISLSPLDFPNWILTQFKDLDEVEANLSKVVIAPVIDKNWGSTPIPLHYIIYDKSGKSLVIEPIDGRLVVFDNPLGILTNSPDFSWHLTNLRNYINLKSENAPALMIDNMTFAPLGQGSGLVGLPGDFLPTARFVRATIYSITATAPKNIHSAVFQTFHILNQFDIPYGAAREKSTDGIVHSDFTQATVVRDPINLVYYFRTYDDQNIKAISLKAFNKDSKELLKTSTNGRQTFTDISKELKAG